MKASATNYDLETKEANFIGMEDGKHHLLKCSNCQALLCDVWITLPKANQNWKVRATCPYCPKKPNGDLYKSFITELKGGFTPGGIGIDKNGKIILPTKNSEEDGETVTAIEDFINDDGILLFKIIKMKGPVYEK